MAVEKVKNYLKNKEVEKGKAEFLIAKDDEKWKE